MIRQLARAVDWRALMVPAGAALLSAGVEHLERRRDAVTAELAALVELVEARRAQLDGRRPLDDEPEPEDSSTDVEAPRRGIPGGLLGAIGLGLVALAGLVFAHRPGPVPDDPGDVYADEVPDPWAQSRPIDDCPCECGNPLEHEHLNPSVPTARSAPEDTPDERAHAGLGLPCEVCGGPCTIDDPAGP